MQLFHFPFSGLHLYTFKPSLSLGLWQVMCVDSDSRKIRGILNWRFTSKVPRKGVCLSAGWFRARITKEGLSSCANQSFFHLHRRHKLQEKHSLAKCLHVYDCYPWTESPDGTLWNTRAFRPHAPHPPVAFVGYKQPPLGNLVHILLGIVFRLFDLLCVT